MSGANCHAIGEIFREVKNDRCVKSLARRRYEREIVGPETEKVPMRQPIYVCICWRTHTHLKCAREHGSRNYLKLYRGTPKVSLAIRADWLRLGRLETTLNELRPLAAWSRHGDSRRRALGTREGVGILRSMGAAQSGPSKMTGGILPNSGSPRASHLAGHGMRKEPTKKTGHLRKNWRLSWEHADALESYFSYWGWVGPRSNSHWQTPRQQL